MKRLLLALIALLGFAAQTAHAEGGIRAMGSTQVGAVQAAGAQSRSTNVAVKSCAPPVMRQVARTETCLPIALIEIAWRAPTVFPRIDRARE